jgi:hypothetical protein
MAAVASTLSPTAAQIKYVDTFGIEHTVSTSQTISMSIDDNSTSDVQYSFKTSLTMTLTDGRILRFRPSTAGVQGTGGNDNRTIGKLTDAGQGTVFYGLAGEWYVECPESRTLQIWKVAKVDTSDADFGAAGTLRVTLEDQFGHVMNWPFQLVSTIEVAQAA